MNKYLISIIICCTSIFCSAQKYYDGKLKVKTNNLGVWNLEVTLDNSDTSYSRILQSTQKRHQYVMDSVPSGEYQIEFRSFNKTVNQTKTLKRHNTIKIDLTKEYSQDKDTICFWKKMKYKDTLYISTNSYGCFSFSSCEVFVVRQDSSFIFNIHKDADSIRIVHIHIDQMKDLFRFEQFHRETKKNSYVSTTRVDYVIILGHQYLKFKGGPYCEPCHVY